MSYSEFRFDLDPISPPIGDRPAVPITPDDVGSADVSAVAVVVLDAATAQAEGSGDLTDVTVLELTKLPGDDAAPQEPPDLDGDLARLQELAETVSNEKIELPTKDAEGRYVTAELRTFIRDACKAMGLTPPTPSLKARVARLFSNKFTKDSEYGQQGINRNRRHLLDTLAALKTRTPQSLQLEGKIATSLSKLTEKNPIPCMPELPDTIDQHPLFKAASDVVGYTNTPGATVTRSLDDLRELYHDSPEDALELLAGQVEAHQVQVTGFANILGTSPKGALKIMKARMKLADQIRGFEKGWFKNEIAKLNMELDSGSLEIQQMRGVIEAPASRTIRQTSIAATKDAAQRELEALRGLSDDQVKEAYIRQNGDAMKRLKSGIREQTKTVRINFKTYQLHISGGDLSNPSMRISKGGAGGAGSYKQYFYSADDSSLAPVAVLRLKDMTDDVREEMRVHKQLQDLGVRNIPRLHDSGGDTIIMENMDMSGEDFGARQVWTGRQVATVGVAIAETLEDMKGPPGWVHMDLKPDNFMVNLDSEGGIKDVKVIDFGLARECDDHYMEHGLMCSGTAPFMAPEVADIDRTDQITGKADIYSLGATLFKMRYGRHFMPSAGVTWDDAREGSVAVNKARAQMSPKELKKHFAERAHRNGQPLGLLDQLILQMLHPDAAQRPEPEHVKLVLETMLTA